MWRKKLIVVILLCMLIVLLTFALIDFRKNKKIPLTAAIIDQLEEHVPNQEFIDNVTSTLTSLGFNVTHHHSSEITVKFLKELPKKNYGIIILRAHFAMRNDSSTVDILTSEEYNETRYITEVKSGLLSVGRYYIQGLTNKSYFAITSDFIREEMEGYFPNSVIFAMGCWSIMPFPQKYFVNPMAKAFLDKNAQVYIGWSNIIASEDSDHETAKLLKIFLTQNKTLAQAINETKTYQYTTEGGIIITTRLSYIPYEAGNLSIKELLYSLPNQTFQEFSTKTILIINDEKKQKNEIGIPSSGMDCCCRASNTYLT